MMAKLAAFIYLCSALTVGWWLARFWFREHREWLNRVTASWVLITFLLLFVSYPPMFFFLAGGVLWSLRPKPHLPAVAYYLAILPAVPMIEVAWVIPFPGLQQLYTLRFTDLVTVVVLLPIALSKRTPSVGIHDQKNLVKKVTAVSLGFVALASLLDFRLTTPTNGMRIALTHFLQTGLLIVVLSRVALLPGALSILLRGILASSLFMLFIGFAQVLTDWFIYSEIPSGLRLVELRYDLVMLERGGVVRIFGTQSPIPHGIFMVFGMALCVYFYFQERNTQRPRGLLLFSFCCAAFSVALVFTGSRGAYLMALIALMIAFLFWPKIRNARRLLVIPIIIIGSVTILASGYFIDFLASDEHGTFFYRYQLILNSQDSIANNLFFGTPDFLNNAMLERSRQGEDLIDIVNAYLGVILRYGAIGLLFYIVPLWMSAKALIRSRRQNEISMLHDAERKGRIILAIITGYATAIFTVSLIGVLAQYYWVVIYLALTTAIAENGTHRRPP